MQPQPGSPCAKTTGLDDLRRRIQVIRACVLAALFLVTVCGDALAAGANAADPGWSPAIRTLYDRAVSGDRTATYELSHLAAAGGASRREASRALDRAQGALVVSAREGDTAARALLTDLAVHGVRGASTTLQSALKAVTGGTVARCDLAFVARNIERINASQELLTQIADRALAGDREILDALAASVRTTTNSTHAIDILEKVYPRIDPDDLSEDDYTALALLLGRRDQLDKTLSSAMTLDRPGARAAVRDLLTGDSAVDIDAKGYGSRLRGDLVQALVKSVRTTGLPPGRLRRDSDEWLRLTPEDEDAVARSIPKLPGMRVQLTAQLNAWRIPARAAFENRVDLRFSPFVQAYVDLKTQAANRTFDALEERIRAAGPIGDISQAEADRLRQDVFDTAGAVTVGNQEGGVFYRGKLITAGWIVDELRVLREQERRLGIDPGESFALLAAGEMLTGLDRSAIKRTQDATGLILSRDERAKIEAAVVNANRPALREQMRAQAALLSTVLSQVVKPASAAPSGPLTGLQDAIKHAVGSNRSYSALVEQAVPIYDDVNALSRLVPSKRAAFPIEHFRSFIEARDETLKKIRGLDTTIAQYIESQAAWKDALTSIGAVAAASALAIPTGGQSMWVVVPVLAAGGAGAKVAFSMGDNYLGGRPYSWTQGAKDAGLGALDGASVFVGGTLSTAARNSVGKRIGLGLLEKGLARELNLQGATLMQRLLVHGVTTGTRGGSTGALSGLGRGTVDAVERINAGKARFGMRTLGEIASATTTGAITGAGMDFGMSSAFAGAARVLRRRPAAGALDPETESSLWRLLGRENAGDLAAANAAMRDKFPQGLADGALDEGQSLALKAYAALAQAKGWQGDAAPWKATVLSPSAPPNIEGPRVPRADIFRVGKLVRATDKNGHPLPPQAIDGINPDGSVRVRGTQGTVALSPEDVLTQNPSLMNGLPVRTTRASGLTEDNWVVEAPRPEGGVTLVQPSTGLRRAIRSDSMPAFVRENADNVSIPSVAESPSAAVGAVESPPGSARNPASNVSARGPPNGRAAPAACETPLAPPPPPPPPSPSPSPAAAAAARKVLDVVEKHLPSVTEHDVGAFIAQFPSEQQDAARRLLHAWSANSNARGLRDTVRALRDDANSEIVIPSETSDVTLFEYLAKRWKLPRTKWATGYIRCDIADLERSTKRLLLVDQGALQMMNDSETVARRVLSSNDLELGYLPGWDRTNLLRFKNLRDEEFVRQFKQDLEHVVQAKAEGAPIDTAISQTLEATVAKELRSVAKKWQLDEAASTGRLKAVRSSDQAGLAQDVMTDDALARRFANESPSRAAVEDATLTLSARQQELLAEAFEHNLVVGSPARLSQRYQAIHAELKAQAEAAAVDGADIYYVVGWEAKSPMIAIHHYLKANGLPSRNVVQAIGLIPRNTGRPQMAVWIDDLNLSGSTFQEYAKDAARFVRAAPDRTAAVAPAFDTAKGRSSTEGRLPDDGTVRYLAPAATMPEVEDSAWYLALNATDQAAASSMLGSRGFRKGSSIAAMWYMSPDNNLDGVAWLTKTLLVDGSGYKKTGVLSGPIPLVVAPPPAPAP